MFKTTFKLWFWIVVCVLMISILGFAAKAILFPAHVINKAMDTAYGVVDQTLTANNAIANYEAFKDMYNSAKAQVLNIVNTKKTMDDFKQTYGDPKTWAKDVRSDYIFQQSNLDGFMMQYQSIVKQYNSDSSKLNRNLFKDSNLPPELPLDYKELK